MGKVGTLTSEINNLQLNLTAKEKLLASNPADVKKFKAEFDKLTTDLKKANQDYDPIEKAAKAAATSKAKDAAQKEEARKKAEKHLKDVNDQSIKTAKLLKMTTEAGTGLVEDIAELKKEIVAKGLERKAEIAKNLKAYGDKKTALIKAYEGASDTFKKWGADAKAKAAEAEAAAKMAASAASPEAAKAPVAKAAQCVKDLDTIVQAAGAKEGELMKLFDPHRSGEKREEYELSLEDVKPWSDVFSRSDNYRKAYRAYVAQLIALKEQAEVSAKQAEVATLSASDKLSALSKIAQDIRQSAEKAFTEMSGRLELQGVVGKDLAGQMQRWQVKQATAEGNQRILTTANTRWGQVTTNEAIMNGAIKTLKANVQKGIAGIPERERGTPLIKAVLSQAQEWVDKADDYEKKWVEERSKGEVEYKKVVALLS
jgi:hypothetical protein